MIINPIVVGAAQSGGGESYVVAETNTGGTWTDGKAIYRQIFTGTASGTSAITLGSISDFDRVIDIKGVQNTAAGAWLPANYSTSNNYSRAYVTEAGNVQAQSNTSGSKTFTVIVYYTKT